MSSNDAFFWAGMAGGRQNRIDKLNDSIDKWEAHAAHLQRVIDELSAENRALRKSRLVWLDNAADSNAQVKILNSMFKEAQGQKPSEYFGGKDKLDNAIDKAKIEERKNGIGKNFNWDL